MDAEQLKSKMENQHTKIEKIFNALENLSESVDNESHKIGSVVVKGAELGSGFSSKEIDL